MSIGQQAKQMRLRIYHHMLKTRGWKYRSFLRYLRFFKYIAIAPVRGEFLESYYVLMRYLDDVVDGDIALPTGYTDESNYIISKIKFSHNPKDPEDEVDYLMLHCFQLAEKFGKNFQEETSDILESLLFDAKRRNKWIIYSREELTWHFHVLDIRGTIRATLKIFNDDPQKYTLLEPLGNACRYQYDIEDFEDDIAAGYINIPLEDCEQSGIVKEDLVNKLSPKVNAWLHHHATDGIDLLNEHHDILSGGHFSLFERLVFKYVYENPARKVFLKQISKRQTDTKPEI